MSNENDIRSDIPVSSLNQDGGGDHLGVHGAIMDLLPTDHRIHFVFNSENGEKYNIHGGPQFPR